MKKILDALEALCRAVPGLSRLEVAITSLGNPMFTIAADSDELVRDLVEQLGCAAPVLGGDSQTEWLTARSKTGPYIAIHGPHRSRSKASVTGSVRTRAASCGSRMRAGRRR